jgi:hypothetical protein
VASQYAARKLFNLHKGGLFLLKSNQIIAATPDGVFYRNGIAQGVLEVKGVGFEKNTSAWPDTPSVLSVIEREGEKSNFAFRLVDGSHMYYSQIQTQMAVTGMQWCHLLVCTGRNGESYITLNIDFDDTYWKQLLSVVEMKINLAIEKEWLQELGCEPNPILKLPTKIKWH